MVEMVATAIGEAHASAGGGGSAAVAQLVRGETAEASILNSGTMAVNAHIAATADSAFASVKLGGIAQTATAVAAFRSFHVTATPSGNSQAARQQIFTFAGPAAVSACQIPG